MRHRKAGGDMATGKLAALFMKIKDACAVTGLSQYFLRQGCRDGSVPHVKSGPTYYVNVPALGVWRQKNRKPALAVQCQDG